MKLINIIGKNLKGTRWEQFVDAIDQYLKLVKQEKINILANKFIPENSNIDNLIDLVRRKGYEPITADGYTSSFEYFKRRAQSIPTEILWLLSETCYMSVLKSFWLNGRVWSLRYDPNGQLYPTSLIVDLNSELSETQLLDQEVDIIYYYLGTIPVPNPPIKTFLPALFLDTYEFPHLDADSGRDATNHFLLDFGFNVVESKDVFISYNTARSLYYTIDQIHRLKEVPHYRVLLPFNINLDKTQNDRKYTDYNFENESYMSSIYLSVTGDLSNVSYVEFGKQYQPQLNQSISGVAISLGILSITGFNVSEQSSSDLVLEYGIREYKKLSISGLQILTFSELALLDENMGCVAYVKFPQINLYENMYSSIKIMVGTI